MLFKHYHQPDTCLALSRRCWAFDMTDRPETRPEVEPHTWTIPTAHQLKSLSANPLSWPVSSKEKPGLIIFDPPASPEGEADGGQVRHTLTKRPPTMTGKAYPDCRKKNTWSNIQICDNPKTVVIHECNATILFTMQDVTPDSP